MWFSIDSARIMVLCIEECMLSHSIWVWPFSRNFWCIVIPAWPDSMFSWIFYLQSIGCMIWNLHKKAFYTFHGSAVSCYWLQQCVLLIQMQCNIQHVCHSFADEFLVHNKYAVDTLVDPLTTVTLAVVLHLSIQDACNLMETATRSWHPPQAMVTLMYGVLMISYDENVPQFFYGLHILEMSLICHSSININTCWVQCSQELYPDWPYMLFMNALTGASRLNGPKLTA